MAREVKIGFMVLAAIAALYLAAVWARGGLLGGNKVRYTVVFQNVNGLKTSDPVTVRGVTVGQVAAITPTDSAVHVAIDVDANQQLRADASAQILVKEILGGKQLELFPGGSKLALGKEAIIPGKPTFDVTMAIARFGGLMELLDDRALAAALRRADSLLKTLNTTVKSVDGAQLQRSLARLESTLTRTDELLEEVQRRQLAAKADKAIEGITQTTTKAEQTLQTIDQTVHRADSMLATTSADARVLLADLHRTMAALEKQNSVAGKLLYDTTLTNRLTYSLDNLNKTLELIRAEQLRVSVTLKKPKTTKP